MGVCNPNPTPNPDPNDTKSHCPLLELIGIEGVFTGPYFVILT